MHPNGRFTESFSTRVSKEFAEEWIQACNDFEMYKTDVLRAVMVQFVKNKNLLEQEGKTVYLSGVPSRGVRRHVSPGQSPENGIFD